MGSGHGVVEAQSNSDICIGCTPSAPMGEGEQWSKKAFKRWLKHVSSRDVGTVIDYSIRLSSDPPKLIDTHEIHSGPDGFIYFTQGLHDRVGRLSPDGHVAYFDTPEDSYPHGIRFDHDGRLYATLEHTDEIIELDRRTGEILQTFSVAFDDPEAEGVVGPHGFAIDQDNRLWYTGKSSDVIGRLDPKTGEDQKFILPTRDNFAPNLDHDIKEEAGASGPINVELDSDGNAWFVSLATSQIGKVSKDGVLSEYEITGLDSDGNTRPINIFQGPKGFIWVTVEGDNDKETDSNVNQTKGGIARFDPETESFIGYQQYRSKGAGGAVGQDGESVWFQYQEDALVQLKINDEGRTSQTTFDIPNIGKRVMHRIAQGPDGSMWFTSNQADAISTITTSTSGLPVYGFKTQEMQSSYLTALPQELIKLDLSNDQLSNLDPLFLSSVKNKQSVATHRFSDALTGATVWSVDRDEVKEFKASDRYSLEGRDFRVYRNAKVVDGLVPVYESDHLQSDVRGWSTNADDFSNASLFSEPSIAWYANPYPLGDISS